MDNNCSKEHLLEASMLQFDWKIIGRRLLKDEQDITDICRDENTEQHKREKVLLMWKEQQGHDATYQKLCDVLTEVGNKDTADKVHQMVTKDSSDLLVNFDAVLANCGCGHCDFKELISHGCPSPRRDARFLCLNTPGLSPNVKDSLLLQVTADADVIFDQLRDVVIQFKSWMEENVSIEEYKKVLTSIPGMMSGKKDVAMLTDRWKEIGAADHFACSAILSDYYTWFNCDILRKVIAKVKTKTQNDRTDILSSLKSYVDEVYKYSKRNIFECPASSGLPRIKGITYFILKVSIAQLPENNEITAEQIATFTAKLKQSLQLEDYTLKLCTVGKGCLQLVYSIPLCVYNVLFPLGKDQLKAIQVLAIGVMEIITKDHHYKKEHVAGSWDLSELHVQSSAIAGTGEEASDLVSRGKLVKKVIKTVEEALLNSSPQVPMSQEEGHEVEKCFDAWKVQMDKLKEEFAEVRREKERVVTSKDEEIAQLRVQNKEQAIL